MGPTRKLRNHQSQSIWSISWCNRAPEVWEASCCAPEVWEAGCCASTILWPLANVQILGRMQIAVQLTSDCVGVMRIEEMHSYAHCMICHQEFAVWMLDTHTHTHAHTHTCWTQLQMLNQHSYGCWTKNSYRCWTKIATDVVRVVWALMGSVYDLLQFE